MEAREGRVVEKDLKRRRLIGKVVGLGLQGQRRQDLHGEEAWD